LFESGPHIDNLRLLQFGLCALPRPSPLLVSGSAPTSTCIRLRLCTLCVNPHSITCQSLFFIYSIVVDCHTVELSSRLTLQLSAQGVASTNPNPHSEDGLGRQTLPVGGPEESSSPSEVWGTQYYYASARKVVYSVRCAAPAPYIQPRAILLFLLLSACHACRR